MTEVFLLIWMGQRLIIQLWQDLTSRKGQAKNDEDHDKEANYSSQGVDTNNIYPWSG